MRGIKEKIAENLSYINPVSRRMLLGAVIIFELLFTRVSPGYRVMLGAIELKSH